MSRRSKKPTKDKPQSISSNESNEKHVASQERLILHSNLKPTLVRHGQLPPLLPKLPIAQDHEVHQGLPSVLPSRLPPLNTGNNCKTSQNKRGRSKKKRKTTQHKNDVNEPVDSSARGDTVAQTRRLDTLPQLTKGAEAAHENMHSLSQPITKPTKEVKDTCTRKMCRNDRLENDDTSINGKRNKKSKPTSKQERQQRMEESVDSYSNIVKKPTRLAPLQMPPVKAKKMRHNMLGASEPLPGIQQRETRCRIPDVRRSIEENASNLSLNIESTIEDNDSESNKVYFEMNDEIRKELRLDLSFLNSDDEKEKSTDIMVTDISLLDSD